MAETTLALFCVTLAAIAILYGSVGQAGASGTIAAMALFGFPAATIKPTSLVLNVLVSVVVSQRFVRAGHVSWRLLGPFALASVPLAGLGGLLSLPAPVFNRLLGGLLLAAALPLFLRRDRPELAVTPPRLPQALLAGGTIGLLSGLTGMGGGVLIAPLLIHRRWARPQAAAGLSSVFILINSAAALLGHLGASTDLPPTCHCWPQSPSAAARSAPSSAVCTSPPPPSEGCWAACCCWPACGCSSAAEGCFRVAC